MTNDGAVIFENDKPELFTKILVLSQSFHNKNKCLGKVNECDMNKQNVRNTCRFINSASSLWQLRNNYKNKIKI